MRIFISLFSALLLGLSTQALAEKIYRWVDESGQTHFSSRPPEEQPQRAQEYNVRVAPPAKDAQAYRIDTSKPEKPAGEDDVVELKPAMTREEAEEGCRKAKEYRMLVTTNFSRRFKQEDGEYRPLTDEQRTAEIKKADDMIERYCNQPSSNKTRR